MIYFRAVVLSINKLKFIKMMNTGYAMDIKIGSSLLKKLNATSSSYININMHNELSKVKKMEMKYELKDPKLLKADPDYPTLGHIGLSGFIQEEYSVLFAEQD